ncbi:HU family DNA-binding protein [Cellulomonas sp. DKR-3]|uniref:HU family DNA-binding protein n=1 Tax=Cellulomonas fulva TaxID=2835530 RepID=A0ABS5TZR6_9CELL|nr:HU family DNA-binding protein [Cellulomonas fulva]
MAGKTQLIDRIVARGSSRAAASAAVDAVLAEVTALLAEGERVTLTGFGSFDPVERAARTARNPRTGASVEVAAARVVRFHPGAALRTAVGGGPVPSAGPVTEVVPVERTSGSRRVATAASAGRTDGTKAAQELAEQAGKTARKTSDAKTAKKPDKKSEKKADKKVGKNSDKKAGKKSDKKSGKKSGKHSGKK